MLDARPRTETTMQQTPDTASPPREARNCEAPPFPSETEPLRGEAFSLEHLEEHARRLAAAHQDAAVQQDQRVLLRRFEDNGRLLVHAYQTIVATVRQGEPIPPQGEWLLDNFHVVEDQLRQISEDLPSRYYRELPRIQSGPLAGHPRVYALAVELIVHTDSSLDEHTITRFVQAYQEVTPLTIGELWAVPIMLRLGLVENLRRLAEQVLATREHRRAAHQFVERWLASAPAASGQSADCSLGRYQQNGFQDRDAHPPFFVHLAERLRDQPGEGAACLLWLEQKLAERGWSLEELVRCENQRQAANQVSVGNAITSMRLLSALDWTVFFETTSLVDLLLRHDPAGIFARMDFPTRDRYRQVVERLARRSRRSEQDVARRVVERARRAGQDDPRQGHIGYHLIGRGREPFETDLGYRMTAAERVERWLFHHAALVYLGSIGLLTALGVLALVLYAAAAGAGPALLVATALLVLLPASDLAVSLVHYVTTRCLRPRVLPKLEFEDGVPPDCRTMVVIPTLLGSPQGVRLLLDHLEIHYLANPEPELSFALLTDFPDAPSAEQPGDEPLLAQARAGIQELNARHGRGEQGPFYLLHRARQWNPVEGKWMGWERKRGKLLEFNRLLRGATDTSYVVQEGDLSRLRGVRYVITLDADTQLPPGTARRLIGTLAHPLNQPRFDPRQGRVVDGYAILQPRVGVGLSSACRSLFGRLFGNKPGVDPYTTAVSDVYQDLFGEGSFIGKGIYDVDAFEAATGSAFPENHILSHDLIEGCHARAGLVTDVELLDESPASYHAYAIRQHRWTRGDWQLLPWLLPRVPSAHGRRRNPLTAVGRWKVFDNLRRSLLPPALLLLLAAGWWLLPGSAWVWTLAALLVPAFPLLTQLAALLRGWSIRRSWMPYWRGSWGDLRDTLARVLFNIAVLPHQAFLMTDAIVRTLTRLLLTRRRLLEWETAWDTERRLGCDFRSFLRVMWFAPAVSIVLGALVFRSSLIPQPSSLIPSWWAALPLLLAWFVSPAMAWLVSQPARPADKPLTPDERRALRRIACRTWSFFERFVGPEDNWLPPDNFQELSGKGVAHRTSPSNEGLFLLSALAAHDFGYLAAHDLAALLEHNLDSWQNLERYQGHFYNWYDTQTTRPLPPRYVSSVDSGNLMACLLTLAQGLRGLPAGSLLDARTFEGLTDGVLLLEEALDHVQPPGGNAAVPPLTRLQDTTRQLRARLRTPPPDRDAWLRLLSELETDTATLLEGLRSLETEIKLVDEELTSRSERLVKLVRGLQQDASSGNAELAKRFDRLADRCEALAMEMDFRLVYNPQRRLLAIGYNLEDSRLDRGHYDLLMSEARLASLLAIAKGDVEYRHWFQLGRPLGQVTGHPVLLSWGGTMFEYLMPLLFLRSYPETLLDESCRTAVARQIEYGRQHRLPWGVSESAFATVNASGDYNYQSFGVPGLGLKRGLAQDLVVAPYATALAVMVRPRLALENLRALAEEGAEGLWGYYEAIDYTPSRVPSGERSIPVRCYMAHHQGMSLLALANCLLPDRMRQRFHALPMVRAVELLLQERLPVAAPLVVPHGHESAEPQVREVVQPLSRQLTTADTPTPRTHLLSNGQYSVMVTNAGTGYSRCQDLLLTRWRPDTTRDPWGQFIYLRDTRSGLLWSAGFQPVCRDPDWYEVIYAVDKATFRRRDDGIETHLEVAVSPENNAEVRQVTLINHDSLPREVEVLSYAEVVLAPDGADLAHPAFSKLFVQTEFLPGHNALLAMRRPRAADQPTWWAVHVLALERTQPGDTGYETDRARFLGRGRSARSPAALEPDGSRTGTTGPVLDPVFSLRRRIRLAPGESFWLAFSTGLARDRSEAVALADQYHDRRGVLRAMELAWAHSQVALRHLHLSPGDAHLFQRLASGLIYPDPQWRAPLVVLTANRQGQPGLWRYGISGDHPIVLARVSETEQTAVVRELLLAHEFWRLLGLRVDLVILNDHPGSYLDSVQEQLQGLIAASPGRGLQSKPGGVHLLRGARLPQEDLVLLQAVANLIVHGEWGGLARQLPPAAPPLPLPAPLPVSRRAKDRTRVRRAATATDRAAGDALLFANGLGGFSSAGHEYVIELPSGRWAPTPWCNVIANPGFGFLVSEAGSGYTWSENSRENKLTPWSNDPVADPPGEAVYLRDEETGRFWSPTPLPIRDEGPWLIRHGQGFTRFEHRAFGIAHELLLTIAPADPLAFVCLKLRNESGRRRRLSATCVVEWVLGVSREQTQMHVATEVDQTTGALLATNAYSLDFGQRVAFLDVVERSRTLTGDRQEFFGRNGSGQRPAALARMELSGRTGAGLDPCGAVQTKVELEPGEEAEVIFLLGQADNRAEVRRLLEHYRDPRTVHASAAETTALWDDLLGTIQVQTPDPALDLLLNRWLLYQVVSCRLWGRSAFYQSGGAYGFRDQLQDVLALVYSRPQLAREHILRAAGRQYEQGDVQHWWHPPHGRGIRTRFSDDPLWLPFAVGHYVRTTGDQSLLEEQAAFLHSPPLEEHEQERYELPEISPQRGTVYEHCLRALERGFRLGSHGLPLMGCGDWNDGMNKVGAGGKGESVWVGWFLLTILEQFTPLMESRGDGERAANYRTRGEQVRRAIEEHAWDGAWYVRAFFDDGTPLGSARNEECRIDSLVQSWSVIAAGATDRTRQAMQSVEEYLVRRADKLILLFTPPLDRTPLDPGYVKGYLPGIRENGGQYTHAALWVVQAFAALGEGNRAMELFDLLSPIGHSSRAGEEAVYRVEPYVVAADVYSQPPHVGRGGWTWYTGSAGWMYRIALEWLLGFRLQGDRLQITPCIPAAWSGFELTYRRGSTIYRVVVENPDHVQRGVTEVACDDQPLPDQTIRLVADGRQHTIRVRMGSQSGNASDSGTASSV
jgi:cyclic beta-1,2-glucan synthetase